ncbi:MAG: hypothetical protein K2X52_15945 [Mycobacteriaceae bacterium]|nr:hypothetical protein [Mycobacteriaceae bacterium]
MKHGLAASIIGASMVVSGVVLAAPGHADDAAAFGEYNWQVICNYVGEEPTPHGIWAANSVLLTQQTINLNYGQMQDAIGYAIKDHCPQYTDIYIAYRSRY